MIANVKRAMVVECVKNGITDTNDIINSCYDAVEGIGFMTAAGYKAWATMDKETIQTIKNRTRPARKHIR